MSTSSVSTPSCCDPNSVCALDGSETAGQVENSLSGFFSNLFDTSSYPARWNCGEWTPLEGWLHIGSDVLIFLAYLAIPLSILYCLWKRRDVPFNSVLILFSAFILSCGTGHLLEAVIFYCPIYRVAGLLKLTTALVSVATAIVLMRLLPRILDLPSLANRNELLERASKTKSEFLANMSHEIRTPMTAILGYATILAEAEKETNQPISEADRLNAVQTIQKNGQHLLTIINDVLDMSKIDANRIEISKVSIKLVELLEEVIGLMQAQANDKGIELCLCPETTLPAVVISDPMRLRQILLNLIGNAIKFTKVGSVTLRVSHKLIQNDVDENRDELSFAVIDTGIGMDADQLATIRKFEAFTQADGSTSRNYGGTGLGLRISNSLATLLGGSLHIESTKTESINESGSNFTLKLPVEVAKEDATDNSNIESSTFETTQSTPLTTDDVLPLAGTEILLVEDGHDNQRLISFFLKQAGANVTLRENGRTGVDHAMLQKKAGKAFDLIIMDMQMPVLDGYDATRELRRRGYRNKIIALTAHAMAEDRNRCLEAGCDDYLSKPIDREKLIQMCQTASNYPLSDTSMQN